MPTANAASTIGTVMPPASGIYPSNSGVVIYVGLGSPKRDGVSDFAPTCGYVKAVGGGVPWLKPRQCVIFSPRYACEFVGGYYVVDQRDILGVQEGVFLAQQCSCDGVRTGCSDPACASAFENQFAPRGN